MIHYKRMTDEVLDDWIVHSEHNEKYDEDNILIHYKDNCEKCNATNERKSRSKAKMPLTISHVGKGSGVVTFIRILVSELKIGDFASYLSRPGISDYAQEQAKCISIKYIEDIKKYIVEWQGSISNDEKPFSVIYDEDDDLSIMRPLDI